MRRLGASADWSRERFTLDPLLSAAVVSAFSRLHERGLVYRGDYMVNWAPGLQTAVSDLEVDYVEEKGVMYYFKYMLVGEEEVLDSDNNVVGLNTNINADVNVNANADVKVVDEASEFLVVATTRLETVLGDSALCVHPDDPRYARMVGRRARVPFSRRTIPGMYTYMHMNFYFFECIDIRLCGF